MAQHFFSFKNTVTISVQCNVNNVYSTLTFQTSLKRTSKQNSELVNKRNKLKMCVS